MSLPTRTTERLVLRVVDDDDAVALFRLFGDRTRMRYWGHPPLAALDDAAELIAEIHEGARRGILLQWAVQRHSDSGLIGTCTLAAVDRVNRRAELGVAVAAEVEGSGIASEAAAEVIRYAFEDLGLHRITADADSRNESAVALLKGLGFRREGLLREHYRRDGEWQDGVLFGLLSSDGERAGSAGG